MLQSQKEGELEKWLDEGDIKVIRLVNWGLQHVDSTD